MTEIDHTTLDIFAQSGKGEARPVGPSVERFPVNHGGNHVVDWVRQDLKTSRQPLIVTGFSSLDQLIDFIASEHRCETIRIVLGSEPSPSTREAFPTRSRSLPQEIRDYWLERGISVRLSAKLLRAIALLRTGVVQARYAAPDSRRLHAKIYVGGEAASLGSSNFTESGLYGQLEANVRFMKSGDGSKGARAEQTRRYEETAQLAEYFWNVGTDYTDQLIALLEELLRLVPWQETLARACAELLDGDWAATFLQDEYLPDDPTLWPSQRQGIAQALYILKERGSVLVADATGSGKTRAGVHLVGAKMHEIITSNRLRQNKAVLIGPPSVTESWQHESALASVPLEVYSHGALSNTRSRNRSNVLLNLRRAQLLCVDEGHNFLNTGSNRTQQLLRNMADHVVLFTATPINKSTTDLLHIADMLGADNLDPSTIKAFRKMLSVRSLSRTLTSDELGLLRKEIAKFTVRRTKRMLNRLIAEEPEAYRDVKGRPCRFPEHRAETYVLSESAEDCARAVRIRELAVKLHGVLYFQRPIALPDSLRKNGVTESAYLEKRLHSATVLSEYLVMSSLRSSRAALVEHLQGHAAAAEMFNLNTVPRTQSGDLIGRIQQMAGKPPANKLAIDVPVWLADTEAHREACDHDVATYEEIAACVAGMSARREQAKAELLERLSRDYEHILAFDSRPITLAAIAERVRTMSADAAILIATGDANSDRKALLERFAVTSETPGRAVGFCSDSLSEGVNLQRAQAVVHLDMPSVVRIAEQRVGRVDRLDSPYDKIHAWWPNDAEAFALRSDKKFIERYETVDTLIGSNMPLPDSVRQKSHAVTAHEAIAEFEKNTGRWDGIEDAFSPVRRLVEGAHALVTTDRYTDYGDIETPVLSRISLVPAGEPWCFVCTRDNSGVPKWLLLEGGQRAPETDLDSICRRLRQRLTPEASSLNDISPKAERTLKRFLVQLGRSERQLLSRKKRRALDEMERIIEYFQRSASERQDQENLDVLVNLLHLLKSDDRNHQPDWDELAARWLDVIRPVWYERLNQPGRNKPLLLKDIRRDVLDAEGQLLPVIQREFGKTLPMQCPADERIVACIVGVPD